MPSRHAPAVVGAPQTQYACTALPRKPPVFCRPPRTTATEHSTTPQTAHATRRHTGYSALWLSAIRYQLPRKTRRSRKPREQVLHFLKRLLRGACISDALGDTAGVDLPHYTGTMRREQKTRAAATLLCSLSVASAWLVGAPTSTLASSQRPGVATPGTSSPPSILTTTAQRRRRDDGGGGGGGGATRQTAARRSTRTSTRMVAAGKNWEWGMAKRSGDAPTPAAQAFGSGQELKLGVLLLNLGGPERPEDVQPFLYNLFADPDIIRLPKLVRWLQAPIASVLAARRYIFFLFSIHIYIAAVFSIFLRGEKECTAIFQENPGGGVAASRKTSIRRANRQLVCFALS